MGIFTGSKKFERQSADEKLKRFVMKIGKQKVVVYARNKQEAKLAAIQAM